MQELSVVTKALSIFTFQMIQSYSLIENKKLINSFKLTRGLLK